MKTATLLCLEKPPPMNAQTPAPPETYSAACSLGVNINKTLLNDKIKARVKAGELTNEQTPTIKSFDDLNAAIASSGATVTPYALTRIEESALPKSVLGQQLEAAKGILADAAVRIFLATPY